VLGFEEEMRKRKREQKISWDDGDEWDRIHFIE
jgi:hypothetical protein